MYNAKVKVTEDIKRLPGFYWMPKLNENALDIAILRL